MGRGGKGGKVEGRGGKGEKTEREDIREGSTGGEL